MNLNSFDPGDRKTFEKRGFQVQNGVRKGENMRCIYG